MLVGSSLAESTHSHMYESTTGFVLSYLIAVMPTTGEMWPRSSMNATEIGTNSSLPGRTAFLRSYDTETSFHPASFSEGAHSSFSAPEWKIHFMSFFAERRWK